jgi:tetratricopeptide (TPR) repeat protein
MSRSEEMNTLVEEAFDHFYAERYAESVSRFKEAIDQNSQNATAWKGIHLVYDATGRENEAEIAILRSVELNPDDDEAWYYLTEFFNKVDCWTDAAFSVYERALERSPENGDLSRKLAIQYKRIGQLEKAEHVMKQALKISPKNTLHFMVLEAILRSQGRALEADGVKREIDDIEAHSRKRSEELEQEMKDTLGNYYDIDLDDDDDLDDVGPLFG